MTRQRVAPNTYGLVPGTWRTCRDLRRSQPYQADQPDRL